MMYVFARQPKDRYVVQASMSSPSNSNCDFCLFTAEVHPSGGGVTVWAFSSSYQPSALY